MFAWRELWGMVIIENRIVKLKDFEILHYFIHLNNNDILKIFFYKTICK